MASKNLLSTPRLRPGIRRLSSMTATATDVSTGGVIVVPERFALPHNKRQSFQIHIHKAMAVDLEILEILETPEYNGIRLIL